MQYIGHPTNKHLKNIVSQQIVKNIPIRSPDIAKAKVLFGPSVAELKGWSTWIKAREYPVERVSIPDDFYIWIACHLEVGTLLGRRHK